MLYCDFMDPFSWHKHCVCAKWKPSRKSSYCFTPAIPNGSPRSIGNSSSATGQQQLPDRRVLKSLKWQSWRNAAAEFSSKKFGAAQPGNFRVEDEDYQGFQSSISKSGRFLNPLTSVLSPTWSFAPGLLHQDSE